MRTNEKELQGVKMNHVDLSLNIGGYLLDFKVPKVMAIINVTPDSFYEGSRSFSEKKIRERITQVIHEGADILDVGGCSTRPGARWVNEEEELERVCRALEIIREIYPNSIISVDTFRPHVAEISIDKWGVNIINDVSGGEYDNEIWDVIAEKKVAYVLTHSGDFSERSEKKKNYGDITSEVITELSKKIYHLHEKKINDIIIDPGFGFSKSPNQSLQLLDELDEICKIGKPILVALSRKTMIWQTLGVTPEESLEGTIALDAIAIDRGADIIRVHDVKAARQTIDLLNEMHNWRCRVGDIRIDT